MCSNLNVKTNLAHKIHLNKLRLPAKIEFPVGCQIKQQWITLANSIEPPGLLTLKKGFDLQLRKNHFCFVWRTFHYKSEKKSENEVFEV